MGILDKFAVFLQMGPTFNFKVGGSDFTSSYVNAGLIVFLLFLLVVTLAQIRRHFIHWSARGAIFGIFLGFLLALVFEGFLVIGGKTAMTEVLGWKNPPKPVSIVLDWGRNRVIQVLGDSTQVPFSKAGGGLDTAGVVNEFERLSSEEKIKVKNIICK